MIFENEFPIISQFNQVYKKYIEYNKLEYNDHKNITERTFKYIKNKIDTSNAFWLTFFNNTPLNLVPFPYSYKFYYPTSSYLFGISNVKQLLNNQDPVTLKHMNFNTKPQYKNLLYYVYWQPISRLIKKKIIEKIVLIKTNKITILGSTDGTFTDTIRVKIDYIMKGIYWRPLNKEFIIKLDQIQFLQEFREFTYKDLTEIYKETIIDPKEVPYVYMNSHYKPKNLKDYHTNNDKPAFFRLMPIIRIQILEEYEYKCWIFKITKKFTTLNFELNIMNLNPINDNDLKFEKDEKNKQFIYYKYADIYNPKENKFNDLGTIENIHSKVNACIFDNSNPSLRPYCDHYVDRGNYSKYKSRNLERELLFNNRLFKARKFYNKIYKDKELNEIYISPIFREKFNEIGTYDRSTGDMDIYFLHELKEFTGFLNADFSNSINKGMDIALSIPNNVCEVIEIIKETCFNNLYSSNPKLEWFQDSGILIETFFSKFKGLEYNDMVLGFHQFKTELLLNKILEYVKSAQNIYFMLVDQDNKYRLENQIDNQLSYNKVYLIVELNRYNLIEIIHSKNITSQYMKLENIKSPNYYQLYYLKEIQDKLDKDRKQIINFYINNFRTFYLYYQMAILNNNSLNKKFGAFARRYFRNVLIHYKYKKRTNSDISENIQNLQLAMELAKTQLSDMVLEDDMLKNMLKKI